MRRDAPPGPVSPAVMREVLGHFVSGIVVVTAAGADGPLGFTCQSFSVAVARSAVGEPGARARPPPRGRGSGRRARSASTCWPPDTRTSARRSPGPASDKFAGVAWTPGPSGAPVLDGVSAWVDCALWAEYDGGDHTIAVGRVLDLGADPSRPPLLYYRGRYGVAAVELFHHTLSSCATLSAMTALQTAVLDLADARDFAFAGRQGGQPRGALGAGFPVPDGFCVGTPAYAQAAATGGLDAVLAEPRSRTSRAEPATALLATPVPADVAAAITAAYVGARRPGAGRGALVGHGRGPAGRELRGPAGHLPERGRRRRRAGRGAPLLGVAVDGPGGGLPRRRGHPACGHPARGGGAADGRRAGRGRAVHRRPDQRQAHPQRARRRARSGRRSRLRRGRPRPLGGRRARDHAGPRLRPRASPTGRCATSSTSAAGWRRTSGRRRTSSGRSTGSGVLWLTQSRAITTLYPVPPSRAARPARPPQRHAGPGPDPPDHADGPVGVPRGGRDAGRAGHRPARRPDGRARGVRRRGRPGVHRHHGGAAQPGRAPGRARSCSTSWSPVRRSSCAGCSPTSRRWRLAGPAWSGRWSFARPVLRILLRYRVPALVALALVRPAAARGRGRRARRAAAGAPRRAGDR